MAEIQLEDQRDLRLREAEHPHSPVIRFGADEPLRIDAGVSLAPFQIAYQTYGTLNADRSNAILICHALTGDQHVANVHPVTGKPGWWESMVGPGRPIDTGRYFVICPNVVGACMGTTGPASIDPATGETYGLNFPVITNFRNTKVAGIIYLFYTKHIGGCIYHFFYIILTNGITKCYQDFIFANKCFCEFNGMAGATAFVLKHKMTGKVRICLQHIFLYLFTQVSNYKNKFMYTGISHNFLSNPFFS